jgi:membrane-associated phospholipid phosphatase
MSRGHARRANAAACVFVLVVALAGGAAAAEQASLPSTAPSSSSQAASPVPELRYSFWLDVMVTGAALGWWLGSEAARDQLAPATCRWCDPPGFDASLRDHLRWQNTRGPDVASYALAIAQPMLVVGLDVLAARAAGKPGAAWVDALLMTEATAIAMAVNQTVKFVVGRERPFVHDLPEDVKPFTARPSDNNLSFFSGHTALTFALATSAGTIASMRGYRLAPWIWTVGIAVATATGYLRIAADVHYASDVLTGAVVGSLAGIAVPYFFHGPRRVVVAPAPAAGGLTLMVHGVF